MANWRNLWTWKKGSVDWEHEKMARKKRRMHRKTNTRGTDRRTCGPMWWGWLPPQPRRRVCVLLTSLSGTWQLYSANARVLVAVADTPLFATPVYGWPRGRWLGGGGKATYNLYLEIFPPAKMWNQLTEITTKRMQISLQTTQFTVWKQWLFVSIVTELEVGVAHLRNIFIWRTQLTSAVYSCESYRHCKHCCRWRQRCFFVISLPFSAACLQNRVRLLWSCWLSRISFSGRVSKKAKKPPGVVYYDVYSCRLYPNSLTFSHYCIRNRQGVIFLYIY